MCVCVCVCVCVHQCGHVLTYLYFVLHRFDFRCSLLNLYIVPWNCRAGGATHSYKQGRQSSVSSARQAQEDSPCNLTHSKYVSSCVFCMLLRLILFCHSGTTFVHLSKILESAMQKQKQCAAFADFWQQFCPVLLRKCAQEPIKHLAKFMRRMHTDFHMHYENRCAEAA